MSEMIQVVTARRPGRDRQPAALDRGEMLADAIDLRDRRARAEQGAGHVLLVGKVTPGAGAASKAEPPPESSTSSSSPAWSASRERQRPLAPRGGC